MKRTRLKPMSDKQRRRMEEYRSKRKTYMKFNTVCEVKGCSSKPKDIHHKDGRGSNTNNMNTWMAVCRPCHNEIHANPSWAREKGYLV